MNLDVLFAIREATVRQMVISAAPTRLACLPEPKVVTCDRPSARTYSRRGCRCAGCCAAKRIENAVYLRRRRARGGLGRD